MTHRRVWFRTTIALSFLFILIGLVLNSCGRISSLQRGVEAGEAQATGVSLELGTREVKKGKANSTPTPIARNSTPFDTITATIPTHQEFPKLQTSDENFQITPTGTIPLWRLCSPLRGYPREKLDKIVSSPYDPPPMGSDDRHQGVDFVYHKLAGVEGSIEGVGVRSVMPGIVAAAIQNSFPYGNFVIVETPYNWLSQQIIEWIALNSDESLYVLYAHLQEDIKVQMGDQVGACRLLGFVGKSGNTEAAHLHLEMRKGPSGTIFESMSAFVEGVTLQERETYELWRKSGMFIHFDPLIVLLMIVDE